MNYNTIQQMESAEIVEKRSRFISHAFYIENKEQAENIIRDITKKYYDAKHNCFAYRFYDFSKGEIVIKASDDGEPAGTAGQPILSMVIGKNLINVLIVVTRYFGGVLLGTGGLMHAYKDATEEVLKKLKIFKYKLGYEIEVFLEYANWNAFSYYCNLNNIIIRKVDYLDKIRCIVEVDLDKINIENPYYNNSNIIRQKPIITDF